MTFDIDSDYSNCDPPICDRDISVRVINYYCENQVIYVYWVIDDSANQITTLPVLKNKVFFSFQQDFKNKVEMNSFTALEPFYTYYDYSGDAVKNNLIYIYIRLEIENTFYKSGILILDISDC